MIKYFKWKNLFSYLDEGEIDFSVDIKDTPDKYNFVAYPDHGYGLSKIATIVGHNCSGKTNIIKILGFIRWFTADSFSNKITGMPITFMKYNGESSFETCFVLDNVVYIHKVKLLLEHQTETDELRCTVLSEELTKQTSSEDQKKPPIFDRKKQDMTFNQKEQQRLPAQELVRTNASIIAALAFTNDVEMQKIQKFWNKLMIADTTLYESRNIIERINITSEHLFKKLENADILHRLKYIFSKLDIGNHKLEFTEVYDQFKKKNIFVPYIERSHNKETGSTSFWLYPGHESNGLINLFFKLYDILLTITKKRPILAIDEIEASLHPEALLYLIKLFCDKENKHSQLLCTTQMSYILSHLKPYQLHMVEKNDDNESEVYRLDQVDGVTPDDDIFKNYMSGLYGAFPNICN